MHVDRYRYVKRQDWHATAATTAKLATTAESLHGFSNIALDIAVITASRKQWCDNSFSLGCARPSCVRRVWSTDLRLPSTARCAHRKHRQFNLLVPNQLM